MSDVGGKKRTNLRVKPGIELGDDEMVSVRFNRTDDPGMWGVESDVLEGEGLTTTDRLPVNVMKDIANNSRKPDPINPRQIPEARQEMLETSAYMVSANFYPGHSDYEPRAMNWVMDQLIDGDLYWVSPEMCQLLNHAYPIMPPTTATADLMPSERGVVFFADSIAGTDAQEEGKTIYLTAMVWGPCQYDVTEGNRKEMEPGVDPETQQIVDTAAYVQSFPDHFKGSGISISTWRKWDRWVPLGRTDWPYDYETEAPFVPPGCTPTQLASIIEDRRILAAFALLSQQTNITYTREVAADRHAVKRLARKKLYTPPKVRLVDIHKHKHVTTDEHESHRVDHQFRWIVSGHWRQQACGPKWTQRKPVYIQPHFKGPEDKPLADPAQVVRVWRR